MTRSPSRCRLSRSRSRSNGPEALLAEALAVHAHLNLTGMVLQESERPIGLGGFCDVFRGLSLAHGRHVAIKRFRLHIYLGHTRTFAKRLRRELHIWSRLHHPNVLPLLGFIIDDGVYPALISEWMPGGTVLQYCQANPNADIVEIVKGIAAGLFYLHAKGVVHSDMKSDNVLVSASGRPLVCDFGISRLLIQTGTVDSSSNLKGSVRWMAVELFRSNSDFGDSWQSTGRWLLQAQAADVWAFGMTVYELLTKQRPYAHLLSDFQVIFAIVQGKLPTPPKSILSGTADAEERFLWSLCAQCWQSLHLRPTMMNIIHEINWKPSTFGPLYSPVASLTSESEFDDATLFQHTSSPSSWLDATTTHDEPDFMARATKRFAWRQNKAVSRAARSAKPTPEDDIFAKRPREAYTKSRAQSGLLSAKLRVERKNRTLSFEQQVAITDVFAPSASDRAWRRTTRKSSIAVPIATTVSIESAGASSWSTSSGTFVDDGDDRSEGNLLVSLSGETPTIDDHALAGSPSSSLVKLKAPTEYRFRLAMQTFFSGPSKENGIDKPGARGGSSSPRGLRHVPPGARQSSIMIRSLLKESPGLPRIVVDSAVRVEGFEPAVPNKPNQMISSLGCNADISERDRASIGRQRRWADDFHATGW